MNDSFGARGYEFMQAFQRINSKALHNNISHCCSIFLDYVGIKGTRMRYNEEEAHSGIPSFVM